MRVQREGEKENAKKMHVCLSECFFNVFLKKSSTSMKLKLFGLFEIVKLNLLKNLKQVFKNAVYYILN